MKFSLNGHFFPLPLRRNPSLAVLLAQLYPDTQGQSCLLPQSWYDNPASEPSLDENTRCATVSCISGHIGDLVPRAILVTSL